MPTTTPGPTTAYLIVLGVVAGLIVLGLATVFVCVRLGERRRWARRQQERGIDGARLDGVLAEIAAGSPAVRGAATDDDEARPGPGVEQARLQVGGPAV